MSEIELSCALPPGPEFADLAALAESLGYARVWIYGSAPLWEDPFVLAGETPLSSTVNRPECCIPPDWPHHARSIRRCG